MILKLMEWIWPGDVLVRSQIRRLNRIRLAELRQGGLEAQLARKQELIEALRQSPRAVATAEANRQHYEVPDEFYQAVLGRHLKYSSGYWEKGQDLDGSEMAMLELYVQRAELSDGQEILDLGCGWGSLSLFLAQRFPNSQILGVSNSNSQREFITSQARSRGLTNVQILTADINRLELPAARFDRVVSVEMLEHVRNYGEVFALLRTALKPNGKLFVHVFAHREFAYSFDRREDAQGVAGDWMEREFFSGGMMPSLDLFLHFSDGLTLQKQWAVPGWHYERTANAWLQRLRQQKTTLLPLLRQTYGPAWRKAWLGWQLFFLACAELFGEENGEQWLVHHLLWEK